MKCVCLCSVMLSFLLAVGSAAGASNQCHGALSTDWVRGFIEDPQNFAHQRHPESFSVTDNHNFLVDEFEADRLDLSILPDSAQKTRLERRLNEVFIQSLAVSDFINFTQNKEWYLELEYIVFKAELYRVFHFLNQEIQTSDFESLVISPAERAVVAAHPDLFRGFSIDFDSLAFKRSYFLTEQFLAQTSTKMTLSPFFKLYLVGSLHRLWTQKGGAQFKTLEEKINDYLASREVRELEVLYAFFMNVYEVRPDLLPFSTKEKSKELMQMQGSRSKIIKSPQTRAIFTKAIAYCLSRYTKFSFETLNIPLREPFQEEVAITPAYYEAQTKKTLERLMEVRTIVSTKGMEMMAFAYNQKQWDRFYHLLSVVEPWLTLTDEEVYQTLNEKNGLLPRSFTAQTKTLNVLLEQTENQKQLLLADYRRGLAIQNNENQKKKPSEEKPQATKETAAQRAVTQKSLPSERTIHRREEKKIKKREKNLVANPMEQDGSSFKKISYSKTVTNSFERAFDVLPSEVQSYFEEEKIFDRILANPLQSGGLKKYNFPRSLRVYKFSFNRVKYRLAYEVQGSQVIFFYVSTRDSFYEDVARKYSRGGEIQRFLGED